MRTSRDLSRHFRDEFVRTAEPQFIDVASDDNQFRILLLADDAFGDTAKARAWLRRPLAEFDGETPDDLARTEAGARIVEKILAKIAWGAAA